MLWLVTILILRWHQTIPEHDDDQEEEEEEEEEEEDVEVTEKEKHKPGSQNSSRRSTYSDGQVSMLQNVALRHWYYQKEKERKIGGLYYNSRNLRL